MVVIIVIFYLIGKYERCDRIIGLITTHLTIGPGDALVSRVNGDGPDPSDCTFFPRTNVKLAAVVDWDFSNVFA